MKRIIFCISLFAFFGSQAQQINPVPDYVFSNKMSVGRNAVTDTAAYFSIGPRYGAIRGMMPPMVTDTASMSATKRNGLLIFSIQKNKYLYWDSVGSKWAEMAGTAGSAITGSGVAGYMPEFTTATNLDTTRLYHSAGRFAIGSTTTTNGVFNVYGGQSYFDTSLKVGTQTLLADEDKNEVYVNTTTDAGAYALQVAGATYIAGTLAINTNGQTRTISTTRPTGTAGENIFIGTSGTTLTGTTSGQSSYNTITGVKAGESITTGSYNTAYGTRAMQNVTTASNNTIIGFQALLQNASSSDNTIIGYSAAQNLTAGQYNTAVGSTALINSTNSTYNTAIGALTMQDNAGNNNTAIGAGSLYSTTSTNNTGVGLSTLFSITTGSDNTAIGVNAGRYNNAGSGITTNTNSIFVGSDSRASANGNSNEIVIGYQGRGNGSNTTTIGNTSTVGTYFPAGEMYINTTTDAGAYALQVAGSIYNTTGGALAVSSGGLGIGTTSIPGSQKLRIAGGDVGLEGQYLYMVNASAQILLGASQESQIVNSDAGSSMTFSRLGASAFMAFNVAGAERLRINNAGEMLVGGADAGAFALQVTGAIYNTTTITSGAPTGGLAKPWRLGEINTVSPTSPNRTIRVEIDGTVYYIHAKTTND